jgi:hypothetical protein
MEDPNLSEVSPSIESLVHEIETRANKADDHVIAAALRLRDLRKRIESGELGENVKWLERAPLNFRKISISRLYELNAIAEADDKRAELERQREKNREKVKKHRETKAALERAMEPERKMLAAWLKTAPIEDVRMTFRQIVMKKHAADPSITQQFHHLKYAFAYNETSLGGRENGDGFTEHPLSRRGQVFLCS